MSAVGPLGSYAGSDLLRTAGASLRAWWVLARIRLLPAVLGLVGLGFGWAHWNRALPLSGARELGWTLVAWTLLHAGTLWLNAAFDRDEGPVLLGVAAPVPPGTVIAARIVLLAAIAAAWPSPAMPVCVLLAELYSHPRLAWKAHPVLGPAVNVVGYGLLTPWAGWAVVGQPWDARTLCMAALVAVSVLGCFFVAQAFQAREDRARGYRTLVALRGATAVVRAARACFALAFSGLFALVAAGWLPAVLALLLPGALWVDRGLAAGEGSEDGGGVANAVEVGRRLATTAGWGMVLLCVTYVLDALSGGPVAGLATVAGHPVR